MSQHIVIGGGSGFIGTELKRALEDRGDRVTLISRTPGDQRITWDQLQEEGLPQCDVVINLAGKHILDMSRFWTAKYRDEVVRSRIETTKCLVESINNAAEPPTLFISTAGKCFYGSQAFQRQEQYLDMDEASDPVGIDFPSQLVSTWEAAADEIDTSIVRHTKLRFGIVLAEQFDRKLATNGNRGIFPLLRQCFTAGLCMSLGSGVQPFPWVHIDDVVGITLRAIDDAQAEGIYNVVAPGIVSNQEFSELLATKLGRKVLGKVPAWLIKAIVGIERSTILLLGQRVRPSRSLEQGYRFKFPDLDSCLTNLTTRSTGGA